ncbi:MAG: fibronectin type III domain-containing protein [Nitrospiraceae bacterium]
MRKEEVLKPTWIQTIEERSTMRVIQRFIVVSLLVLGSGTLLGCGGDDGSQGQGGNSPAGSSNSTSGLTGPDWATATLAWAGGDPSVSGYNIYYGTMSGSYEGVINVGGNTEYTISNLEPGTTYYFAVTAYNDGGESGFSGEVSKTVPI